MTATEFLIDTINFYHSENRNLGSDRCCKYVPVNGNKGCAVGRFLIGHDIDPASNRSDYINFKRDYPELIPTWMKDLDDYFIQDVQALHDSYGNWDKSGLSIRGVEKVKQICEKFVLNYEQIVVSCPCFARHKQINTDDKGRIFG